MRPRHLHAAALALLIIAGLLPGAALGQGAADDGFADRAFRQVWAGADAAVAAGGAGRSWTWGELPGERRYERYDDSPGASRLVQYFDKARMEVSDPAGDRRSPWFVTCGLLVVELISGRAQVGAAAFVPRPPANIPVAGDPADNPGAPTYAMLAPLAAIDGGGRASPRLGQRVSATFGPAGLGDDPALAGDETTITSYDDVTGRNVPRVFQRFMQAQRPATDPLFAFGRPITEAYWARARVAGREVPVLFQAFERRLLTYNPANPAPWQVEMGNVGQHYLSWRHGHALRYARPAPAEPISVRETTVSIPTYDLAPALRPTRPGDPIFPYDRLDRAQVGPLQPRDYTAVVVENRFLTLTFLPELGGRLLQAVDRASGRPIFYQNPVVKPSPFGQRGWWLGVGGLEWAAPTEEHGYLENLPWWQSVSRAADAVTVANATTERQTGLTIIGSVTLRADEARFAVRMLAQNPTDAAQPLQMWTNASLSPAGDNQVGPGMRFVVPSDRMIVHATQDGALPGARGWISWPSEGGRDLSAPASWTGYLGAFAPAPVPFLAAYDVLADSGAAVIHGPGTVGGKIFGFSQSFERSLYTDDGSAYVELWSGAQPTFWDYPPLESGGTRAIETSWLPLWGLGRLAVATSDGALGTLRRDDGGLTVTLATPRVVPSATVTVSLDGREVFRSAALALRPDQPLAIELPPGAGGRVRVEAAGLRLEAAGE
ncbi:DUF5107 domain-containing protein [Oscillochloris sp. ZM17-4]|uniref:DUF5107 domain-containing protein n=1 Tax=Oscillochloris sp. ZM17-4 TaxID=2866714 RepID=UPI001C738EDC|nr:DUF5107 domain-containing protein [Oscillochloris sp. ZM17-4]MBX0328598.1 DUF5107 domain-containing protein [Oscillochloris sp. ZM17-4]